MAIFFEEGWYVLYVKSRHEKKVNTSLVECGLNSYLPLIKTIKKWGNRKRTMLYPLFSSYVFVYIEKKNDFMRAQDVVGACFFIRFGQKLAKVKSKEIEAIKILLESDYSEITTSANLPVVGEIRTIRSGVLAGLECEVLDIRNKHEVVVHIKSLQIQLSATIRVECLEF